MLDDLRNQIDDDIFDDDEIADDEGSKTGVQAVFLGMTPPQRFVIATMIMMIVCILSSFCLLVTERVALPIY